MILSNFRFPVLFFLLSIVGVQSQVQFFSSFDAVRIAYTDEGNGKPILLLHGFMNSGDAWNQTILKKELLHQGYRVIVPDLRGNGQSDAPQNSDAYSNDAEIKDIIALANMLQLKKYDAIGYSRGSIILAKLLTEDRRIKKAVIGGMGLDFTNPNWNRRIMFSEAFAGNSTLETEGAVTYAKSIGADLKVLHWLQKYQPVTSQEELKKIKAKVLVLAGKEDVANGNPIDLKNAIPRANVVLVKGDHNGAYKNTAFSEAVLSFLK
ncbi:alpha/beta fold hydrolase [Arenibacter sp. GZD96]|uniref:alpha/beta fold hydrolase n=1 Tax=Aurantibrevibacter litoralis TaxID=3106030 RepID=UPI002AFFCAA2|nr:alpha/beta fold hydrolase [Arenibacter sp. GZD-96]MEA1786890.1 alpha/beta fold hydrolase [Arenibacter sp. GZD-96]